MAQKKRQGSSTDSVQRKKKGKARQVTHINTTKANRLCCFVIVVIGAGAYSNSFSGAFVFDDIVNIVDNESIRSLADTWRATKDHFPGGLHRRPIGRWSFALNYSLGGIEPMGFHLWNLAVHLIAGLFLFGIIRRTLLLKGIPKHMRQVATTLAFVVSLLWVVHPLQTESVTYIVQRLESMMGMFYLGCLYFLIRGSQSERRLGWYLSAVACCWLGMATKEVMITAPVVIGLYDRVFLSNSWRNLWRQRWWVHSSFFMAAFWLGWISVAEILASDALNRAPTRIVPDRWGYFLSQPGVILHYLRLCIWPDPLCLDYGWKMAEWPGEIVLPAIVVSTMLIASLLALLRCPRIGFLCISFFLILAPTSTILPLSVAFEHRMYLPLVSVVSLLVLAANELLRWFHAKHLLSNTWSLGISIAGVSLVASAFAYLTYLRNQDYADETSMYRDVVQKSPENPRGHFNLARKLYEINDLDGTMLHYQTALKIDPHFPLVYYNLAILHEDKGRPNEAIRHYQAELEIQPEHVAAHFNLALLYEKLDRVEEAIAHYKSALQSETDYVDAYHNLGTLLLRQRRYPEAAEFLETAIHLDPSRTDSRCNLALALVHLGQTAAAIKHLEFTLLFDPNHKQARIALSELTKEQGR